ncbi:MAG: hypothetical protein MI863_01470 [Desulfobacterales bacterium]|nr:hypothetical protein [Desulfobacterales bacterium]
MSREYSLDLKQNAIDSLSESIRYYEQAVTDESKYKFCIILFFHFIELLLKSCVEKINPLLCYKEPYSSNIHKAKTITWFQAIQIIVNSKNGFSKDLIVQIEILSKLRNNITHYKFEYKTSEIRKVIAVIVPGLIGIYKEATGDDLFEEFDPRTVDLLDEIQTDYNRELHLAQAEALEEAGGDRELLRDCYSCISSNTAVQMDDELTHCFYCDEIDIIVECGRCTQKLQASEMTIFGETEGGHTIYMCDYCLDYMDAQ